MNLTLASREATRPTGGAELVNRLLGRCRHLRMAVESQVIVGGKIDQRPAFDRRDVRSLAIMQAIEGILNSSEYFSCSYSGRVPKSNLADFGELPGSAEDNVRRKMLFGRSRALRTWSTVARAS